jgi:hypothetical protein
MKIKMFSTGQYKLKGYEVIPILEEDTTTKEYVQHRLKGFRLIIILQKQEKEVQI